MKKEILDAVNVILIKKEFLDREDVKELSKKFVIKNKNLVKEIQAEAIPCMAARLKSSLEGFGISVNENKILLSDFNALGSWKTKVFKSSKINVVYSCRCCNKSGQSRLSHIIQRKFFSLEPICSKCIEKEVANTEEWKSTNSIAQLIAQNKPEQIEKNRQAQINRFENEDIRKQYREASIKVWERPGYKEKMSDIARKKWDNPEYARKVIENSKRSFKCGFYKGLYYNSSYELAFILKLEGERSDLECVKRANTFISYKKKNDKIGHYYPDFILDDKFLIEVKGYGPWVDLDNLSRKNKAAKTWCKDNNLKFRVVELKDFSYFWLRKALQKHKELIDGKTEIKNDNTI